MRSCAAPTALMIRMPMRVEVIYASSDRIWTRRNVDVPKGATVATLLVASGLLVEYPEIDFSRGYGLAIYGVAIDPSRALCASERVEILRPLQVDPKEARRARARKRAEIRGRALD